MNLIQKIGLKLLGKSALYDLHPELRHRVPIYRSGQGLSEQYLNENYWYYKQNVWTRKAVDIIANNLAWMKTRVVRTGDGKTWEPVRGHPITGLIEYVNDVQAPDNLMRAWAINMLIDGECGWELTEGYREIWTRQSAVFNVRIPKGGRRYMRILGYHIDDDQGDEYTVPPENFVHFKFYNPSEPLRGLSPVAAIRTGVEIDEFARAWSRMFFENQARPDFIALAPQGTTRTEREEIRDSLEGDAKGLDNYHRIVVLEDGVIDVKPLNLAPVDTQWLEQRKFSREEIGGLYGVPDELMGFGRDTYENFDTAQYVLWNFTLIPLIRSRDSTLTEFFRRVGQLRPNEKVETDLTEIRVLQEDLTEKIDQATRLIDRGTPPNLAFEVVGLSLEIPGGDTGYMPISMVPLGASPYLSPPTTERSVQTKEIKAPTFGSMAHEKAWQRKVARIEPFERQMQRMLRREFQRQQNEVGRALRDQKTLGRAGQPDIHTIKQNAAQLFNLQAEKERFKVEFLPLLLEAIAAVGAEELSALDIGLAFDMNRPEVQAEIAGILSQFAEKTNDTTYTDLVDLFKEAEESGDSIPDIMERLSAYFGDRKSEYQTERIARTTMTSVNSAGDDAAWQQSGVVTGSEWLASIDGREREAHRAAHGQFRGLGQMFEVDGEMLAFPGDPNGSPGNIINCRCSRLPVLK